MCKITYSFSEKDAFGVVRFSNPKFIKISKVFETDFNHEDSDYNFFKMSIDLSENPKTIDFYVCTDDGELSFYCEVLRHGKIGTMVFLELGEPLIPFMDNICPRYVVIFKDSILLEQIH